MEPKKQRPSQMSEEQLSKALKTGRHADHKKSAPDAETPSSREPNKANFREKLTGAARTAKERLVKSYQDRQRRTSRKMRPHNKRRVHHVDRFEGGELKERIYYDTTAHKPLPPKNRPRPRQQRSEPRSSSNPFGDVGAFSSSDFLSNMTLPDMNYNPMAGSTRKKGRQDNGFDYLSFLESAPFR